MGNKIKLKNKNGQRVDAKFGKHWRSTRSERPTRLQTRHIVNSCAISHRCYTHSARGLRKSNLEYRESPDELTSHVPLHLLDDGVQSLNLHYYVHHVVRYHSLQSHL